MPRVRQLFSTNVTTLFFIIAGILTEFKCMSPKGTLDGIKSLQGLLLDFNEIFLQKNKTIIEVVTVTFHHRHDLLNPIT